MNIPVPLKVKIIQQMNDNEINTFTVRLHSFIEKWTVMMLDSISNSVSGILDFFFTKHRTFHIVFFY